MAVLAIQHTSPGLGPSIGLSPVWTAASSGGDSYPNTGAQWLLVRNQSASPVTLTVIAQNPSNQGFFNPGVVVIPAAGLSPILLGPYAMQFYNDANGFVNWTYSTIAAPLTAPVVAVGAAGLPNGTYPCQVTFVGAGGVESIGGPIAVVTVASQQIAWSAIPIGPTGTTARKLYRYLLSAADTATLTESVQITGAPVISVPAVPAAPTGTLRLVTTIADNTTTVFTDNVADAALGVTIPILNVQVAVIAP